jgi:hypothetical protein
VDCLDKLVSVAEIMQVSTVHFIDLHGLKRDLISRKGFNYGRQDAVLEARLPRVSLSGSCECRGYSWHA